MLHSKKYMKLGFESGLGYVQMTVEGRMRHTITKT